MSIFLAIVSTLKNAPWQIWAILAAMVLLATVWAAGVSQGRALEKRAQQAAIERAQAAWREKYAQLEDERSRLDGEMLASRRQNEALLRELSKTPIKTSADCQIDYDFVRKVNQLAAGRE